MERKGGRGSPAYRLSPDLHLSFPFLSTFPYDLYFFTLLGTLIAEASFGT